MVEPRKGLLGTDIIKIAETNMADAELQRGVRNSNDNLLDRESKARVDAASKVTDRATKAMDAV